MSDEEAPPLCRGAGVGVGRTAIGRDGPPFDTPSLPARGPGELDPFGPGVGADPVAGFAVAGACVGLGLGTPGVAVGAAVADGRAATTAGVGDAVGATGAGVCGFAVGTSVAAGRGVGAAVGRAEGTGDGAAVGGIRNAIVCGPVEGTAVGTAGISCSG